MGKIIIWFNPNNEKFYMTISSRYNSLHRVGYVNDFKHIIVQIFIQENNKLILIKNSVHQYFFEKVLKPKKQKKSYKILKMVVRHLDTLLYKIEK